MLQVKQNNQLSFTLKILMKKDNKMQSLTIILTAENHTEYSIWVAD